MGQPRDISRTRDDSQDNHPSSSGDKRPAKKQVHWLDDSDTSGKIKPHETASHTDSAERGRSQIQTLEPLQSDRSDSSSSTSSQRDLSPFRASGKRIFDGIREKTKPEMLEKERAYHQTLFEELKQNNTELDRVNVAREKDINARGVEHDDDSPLSERAYELMEKMSSLGKELENGPLRDEVEAWYQQQEAAEHTGAQAIEQDMAKIDIGRNPEQEREYHQGLFDEVERDYAKLDIINEKRRIDMNRRGVDQDYESPLFQEAYDIKDKIRLNQRQLEEGPLKGEFEKWKQDFEENVKKHEESLFREMDQKGTRLLELEKGMGKGELRKEVEMQGEEHPLMQEMQRIKEEINSLQQRLEDSPLEDDVNAWNRQQEGKRLEYHQGLFNEFEQKGTRLLKLEKEMGQEGLREEIEAQGSKHLLMQEMWKLDEEVDLLGQQLKKGPLKSKVEDWYEQ